MIDYTGILTTLASMAFIMAILLPVLGLMAFATMRIERVVTQRRQHRDTLAEIRRLKADQAYAALCDMAGYFRAELKHGQHEGKAYEVMEKAQQRLWDTLEDNGIHLDEEYQ